MEIIKAFLVLFAVSFLGFGGGYTVVALLFFLLVERFAWMSENTFFDLLGLAQATPGAVLTNVSSYLGYHLGGVWGAFFLTVASIIPSVLFLRFLGLLSEKNIKLFGTFMHVFLPVFLALFFSVLWNLVAYIWVQYGQIGFPLVLFMMAWVLLQKRYSPAVVFLLSGTLSVFWKFIYV